MIQYGNDARETRAFTKGFGFFFVCLFFSWVETMYATRSKTNLKSGLESIGG